MEIRASTQINNDDHLLQLDGTTPMNGDLDLDSNRIINVATPTSGDPDHVAANKGYVDAARQGFDYKESVRLAVVSEPSFDPATAAPDTVDGVGVSAGDRILIKSHATASTNGIYVVDTVGTGSNGSWSRAADADADDEVSAGMTCFVSEGSTHADERWALITDDPITVGTTALDFTKISSATGIQAGSGLTKSGDTINFVAGNTSLTVAADSAQVNHNVALVVDENGLSVGAMASGTIAIGQGASVPASVTSLSGDVSMTSAGVVTVATANATIDSTGSGIQVADANAGSILIGQGAPSDTVFTAITGDVSLAADGSTTVSSTVVSGNIVANEDPSGLINGSNTIYTTANNFVDGTEKVFKNGIRQDKGSDYTVTAANEITMSVAPLSGDDMMIDYAKA